MLFTLKRNRSVTHPLNAVRLVGGFTQHHFSMQRSGAGFTLLELLTVIAIIGILSSIVMVSLGSAREKARDGRRIAEIKNLQLALSLYFDVNSRYPTVAEFTTPNLSPPQVSLSPVYISTMPKDPLTGGNYIYSALGSGVSCFSYHLGAILEDPGNSELDNSSDELPGTVCTGGGTAFHGDTTNCIGPTAAPPDLCYDVKAQ